MIKKYKPNYKLRLVAGLSLLGLPAAAWYGGGLMLGAYYGPLPTYYYEDVSCFTDTVSFYEESGLIEVQVNPRGVQEDGNPNTYLRCVDYGDDEGRVICHAGLPDGKVISCNRNLPYWQLPELDDRVYIIYDTSGVENYCELIVEKSFGEANPACRPTSGTGGSGGGPSAPCDASNADAILSTGQSTLIPSNACVQLRVDPVWSQVNPQIEGQPGTSVYPVPFSYTSCAGNGSGVISGNWVKSYLVDESSSSQPNFHCDVFLRLEGNGSLVNFVYYN